jgi:branched-chain amino acid transport system ATP-binding protein
MPISGERQKPDMILEIRKLNTYYGNLHALWDIDLGIPKGEIVALIGNNGAGKTTLLRSIMGSTKPRSGSILFSGEQILGKQTNKLVYKGITLSPEGRQVFPKMTVLENLRMGGFSRNKSELPDAYLRIFDLFPVLNERKQQAAGTLSGGEQQMLAIGRALMSNPKLLLLDEPSLGLSPILSEKIFELIKQIRSTGVSILLVEQNAIGALMIADRGYVLENGRIVHSGTSHEILNNPIVHESYLGGLGE